MTTAIRPSSETIRTTLASIDAGRSDDKSEVAISRAAAPVLRFGVTLDDWMTRCHVEPCDNRKWQVSTPDRTQFLHADSSWSYPVPARLPWGTVIGFLDSEAAAYAALAKAKPYPGAIVTDDASPSMLPESTDTRDGEFVSKLAALNADLAALAMDVGRVHSRNRILQAQCDELVRRNKILGDAMRRIERVVTVGDIAVVDLGDKLLSIAQDAIDAAKVPPMRREVEPDSDPDADIKRDDDRERARDMGLGAHGR